MIRVLSIFGTRPEAVKMAPVIKALQQYPDQIESIVCSTGQHREMLDMVLSLFGIQPDYDLKVMQPDQSLTQLTTNLMQGLDGLVQQLKPDWILAQGDTTTVMVAAMVAYYHRVRFGHIEAGLRTYNKYQPFPEEGNRRVADLLADACFAPTAQAAERLASEGVPREHIYLTGNTVVDALLAMAERPYTGDRLNMLSEQRPVVMITAHRRESFGDPFLEICHAIRDLALAFADVQFVYPVHLNPHVQEPVRRTLSDLGNVYLIDPLDYLAMLSLMKRATLILTDSGGIQEEAPTFRVPLLVMRDATERPEGIEAGVARLVGTNRARIVAEASAILSDPAVRAQMQGENPYGDGRAAQRIIDILLTHTKA